MKPFMLIVLLSGVEITRVIIGDGLPSSSDVYELDLDADLVIRQLLPSMTDAIRTALAAGA